ncbi:MAG: hypothetical protein JST00_32990 [Deltaproteobacteria bacterium]|nr:hypothetical protein [Deltaproteobacteria bacterium]
MLTTTKTCCVPGCGCAVYHAASDYCSKHVHEARCFDVVAIDRGDPANRHALVVIAVSDDDAKRVAFSRLLARARGPRESWAITSVAEMELREAG